MPTAIDEQGDTGWFAGERRRSASHFRLAAVFPPTRTEADACRAAIRQLRAKLSRVGAFPEFHYTAMGGRSDRRRAFFELVADFGYRFAVASFDKRPRWRERPPPGVIFWTCAVSLAASLRPL